MPSFLSKVGISCCISWHLSYQKINDYYRILVSNTKEAVHLIHKYPDLFVDFEITKGKMDDVFLNATGYDLEVE